MALMDEIAGSYKPAQVVDQSVQAGGGVFNQGMNIGVNMADNIAKMQLQHNIQTAELGIRQKDLEEKQNARDFDYLKLATNQDLSPSARKAIATSWKTYRQEVMGVPTDDNTMDLLTKDPGTSAAVSRYAALARGLQPGTPEYDAWTANTNELLGSVGAGNAMKTVDVVDKMNQFPDQLKKIQALTKQKITADALTQKKQKGYSIDDMPVLTQGYIDAGFDPVAASTYAKDQIKNSQLNAAGGSNGNNPRVSAAKTAMTIGLNKGVPATADESEKLLDPKLDPDEHAQVLADYMKRVGGVTSQVTQSGIQANVAKAGYFKQIIPLKYAELKNHTDSVTLSKLKEVDNAPDVVMASKNSILAGDAFQIINKFLKDPNAPMRKQDLFLINKEMNRQLTGASRGNMSDDQALEVKTALGDSTKALSYVTGDNLTNVGRGVAVDAMQRFQRVIGGLNEGRKRAYSAHVNNEVGQGLLSTKDGQMMLYNDAGHFGYDPVVIDSTVPQQWYTKSSKIQGGFPGKSAPASNMITMPNGKKYTPDYIRTNIIPQLSPAKQAQWKQYLDKMGTQ